MTSWKQLNYLASALLISVGSLLLGHMKLEAQTREYLRRSPPVELRFSQKQSDFDRTKLIPILKEEDLSDKGIIRRDGKVIPEFLSDYSTTNPIIVPLKDADKKQQTSQTPSQEPVLMESIISENKAAVPDSKVPESARIDAISTVIEKNLKKGTTKRYMPFQLTNELQRPSSTRNDSSASYTIK